MLSSTCVDASPIRCLISAGPTREFFDPVRYVSNPSSGKMGFALAAAAARAGWQTHLIAGPVSLPTPDGVTRENVVTGEEMYRAVDARFDSCDVLIMTAALIDFRPKRVAGQKVKKPDLEMVIEMEPVVDVLKTVAARKRPDQLVVGFAAETNDVTRNAEDKLRKKNADFIVANQIGVPGSGFESDENRVLLLSHGASPQPMGPALKTELAERLIERFADWLSAQKTVREEK